jgi:hypothetical protein
MQMGAMVVLDFLLLLQEQQFLEAVAAVQVRLEQVATAAAATAAAQLAAQQVLQIQAAVAVLLNKMFQM